MVVYGYVKGTRYTGDGTLLIQVRIPNIHGPYLISDYKGKAIRNYTSDNDLPWYPSLILPYLPGDGEVVALTSLDDTSSSWLVLGLTGGSYNAGAALS
jgi:hypothetical protein